MEGAWKEEADGVQCSLMHPRNPYRWFSLNPVSWPSTVGSEAYTCCPFPVDCCRSSQ